MENVNFEEPRVMAKYLAKRRYPASTIHAHVKNYFGRDVKITRDHIEKLVAKEKQAAEAFRTRYDWFEREAPEDDEQDFAVGAVGRRKPTKDEIISSLPPISTRRHPWPEWYAPPTTQVPAAEIVRGVAKEYGVTPEDIKGKARSTIYVTPRSVIARILRDRGLSYPVIGRLMGGRDHSTIMNLLRRFDDRRERDPFMMSVYRAWKG